MTKITVNCRGSFAAAKLEGQITTGMVGLPVELHWDGEWDGLAKALIFRNSRFPDAEQSVVAAIGENVTVPGAILTQAGQLQVSAEGISRDGKRVLHTQWVDCGKIRESGSTANEQEPDPSLVQQLLILTDQAAALAKEARDMAAASGIELDETLTQDGMAADAAAVGKAVHSIREDFAGKLTEPATAQVGQIFRVASIDADGHYVLEAVDAPSGGVIDVNVNGASAVTDGIAYIRSATNGGPAGVVAIKSAQGVTISSTGVLGINQATNANITNRTSSMAITAANMDNAVKAAMCDGKGEAWTAGEQAAAQERIGIRSVEEVLF